MSTIAEFTLYGDTEGTNFQTFHLISRQYDILYSQDLPECPGCKTLIPAEAFTLPNQPMLVMLSGRDQYGNAIQRIDPCAITPVDTESYLEDVDDITVDAGSTTTITTTFYNENITENFNFGVSDNRGFVAITGAATAAITVAAGEELTLTMTITVPGGVEPGSLSKVVLTATGQTSGYFVFTAFVVTVRDTVVRCPSPPVPVGGTLPCVPDSVSSGSECMLTCGPEYILEGVDTISCQADGSWDADLGTCRYIGSQTCVVSGDPHYTTFDGHYYDFMGGCLYTLVDVLDGMDVEPVTISAENQRLFPDAPVSWFKQGFINVYGITVHFKSSGVVLVDGIRVYLPAVLAGGKISLRFEGGDTVLSTDFKLVVRYDGYYYFRISLPGSYIGKVQGICGNYDGDRTNEFMNNGTVFTYASELGNSYEIVGGSAPGCRKGEPGDEDSPCDNPSQEAIYAEKCAFLKGYCFENCGTNVTKNQAFKDCVVDMCATAGADSALEEVIKAFAESCNAQGIATCNWRDELDLPKNCPANSRYVFETNPCPNTCVDRKASQRCAKLPLKEGCICVDGYVKSDVECVPVSECGCATGGRYYKKGEAYIEEGCERSCVCTGGEIVCEEYACTEGTECRKSTGRYSCLPTEINQCHAVGDPHYRTLDGTTFDFMGKCCYAMLNATGPSLPADRQILVLSQNEYRHGNTRVSYVRLINIEAEGYLFTLGPDKHAQVKYMNKTTVITGTQSYQSNDEMYLLRFEGLYATFRTSYGMKVRFDGMNLFIDVPSYFMNKVSGLCGNYTGMAEDDFGGSSIEEFATQNLFPNGCTEGPMEPFECSDADNEIYGGANYCGKLRDPAGDFAECHDLLDVDQYYDACVLDVCANEGDEGILASSLEVYAEACKSEGLEICNWRRQPELVPQCPDHSTYGECKSVCTNTCQNPRAEASCDTDETAGKCVCDLGYLMSDGECVLTKDCGCTMNEEYVLKNTVFMATECEFSLTCNGANDITRNDDPCGEQATCKIVDGEHACVPNEYPYALIYGDPHHKTFDGKYFDFRGDCSYLFVAYDARDRDDMDDVPSFRIIVTNERRTKLGATRLEEAVIEVEMPEKTSFIHLKKGKVVLVNGVAATIGTHLDHINVLGEAGNVAVTFDFGLRVHYNGDDWLRVDLDPKFAEKTSGMAGNFNGDPEDDLRLGDMMFTGERWGDFWRSEHYSPMGCSATTPEFEHPCDKSGLRDHFARDCDCGVIAAGDGPFAACHAVVDPEPFLQGCVYDACAHDGNPTAIAKIIVAYYRACRGKGILPGDWRAVVKLPEMCPENSHYDESASGCPPTCGEDDTTCTVTGEPGCVCDEGFKLSNGKCVDENRCGCTTEEGYYFEHGACVSKDNCTMKCTCIYGEWDCEISQCYPGQWCGVREGEMGCHWHDECKYDNGGCSGKCSWMNGTVGCSCAPGMILGKDGKTCIEVSGAYLTEDDGTCGPTVSMWRAEFLAWRYEYLPQWQEELENYKKLVNGEISASDMGTCNVYWTEWFNRDAPAGCGDEEILENIRIENPDFGCEKPLAIDVRLADGRYIGAEDDYIEMSVEMGLVCKNAEQPEGRRCSDYKVRFLCPGMEKEKEDPGENWSG